jgi:hypothetical protein
MTSTRRGGARVGGWEGALGVGLLLFASTGCYQGVSSFARDDDHGSAGDAGSDAGDESGAEDGGEPAGCDGGAPMVAARPLRRLTPGQYQNTMRDLLGDPGFVAQYDATEPVITERAVRQLRDGAELALSRRAEWTAAVFPCDIEGASDDACADGFIDQLAPRAFRRPLQGEEREWLRGVYLDARAELGFTDAMEVLAATVLQAPAMIYLEELGTPVEGAPETLRRLTDHELASRLSYFLWDTMPDDALRQAADAGALTTNEGLRAQVERLLDDPRAEARIQRLLWSWLQLDGGRLHFSLEEAQKRADLYPEYGPALQEAMRTELEAFVADVLRSDAGFEQLLTSNRAYVNGPLAALYGVQGGPVGEDEWAWVELPATQRAGVLTRAAFLSVFSNTAAQSPIRRGTFTLEEVLCMPLGDPPPDVDDTPIDGGEQPGEDGEPVVMTVREATEARTAGTECRGCHSLINPVGYAFEHYDAIGRWQDDELVSGRPVDASGLLQGTDVDGPVMGARALSEALAGSAQVRACFAERWLEEALGGALGELDQCTHDRVTEAFTSRGDLRQLVVAIALSDGFRHVNLADEAEEGE